MNKEEILTMLLAAVAAYYIATHWMFTGNAA